ncbi:retrovirus-related pol polyprotein from transposon TNT 1-94, partial [Tanacetum coccineum]
MTWKPTQICKKQTIVATSTIEAEYVAAANCRGQNPVFHYKTKHIEIRHHFIRDAYEKKLIQANLSIVKLPLEPGEIGMQSVRLRFLRHWVYLKLIAESASDGAYDLLRFIQKQI